MVRAGLGPELQCLFANDIDPKKARAYEQNWGGQNLIVDDVRNIDLHQLSTAAGTKPVDLVWASFPCQDLSLAGDGAGLHGHRSGAFWPFWNLIEKLQQTNVAPSMIILENVCGTLTANSGRDFANLIKAFSTLEYRVGALVINADAFVPQSRPRLFIIGVKNTMKIPAHLVGAAPAGNWITTPLSDAYQRLDGAGKAGWVWWSLEKPSQKISELCEVIDLNGPDIEWHDARETEKLISMMSAKNRSKLDLAKRQRKPVIGTMYRRTRREKEKGRVQRVEVRFDGIAGCLRTPAGGSSRQLVIAVDGEKIRTRLISARESARLMGLADSYILPSKLNDALRLTGDGVAVPVVSFLQEKLIDPILSHNKSNLVRAA